MLNLIDARLGMRYHRRFAILRMILIVEAISIQLLISLRLYTLLTRLPEVFRGPRFILRRIAQYNCMLQRSLDQSHVNLLPYR